MGRKGTGKMRKMENGVKENSEMGKIRNNSNGKCDKWKRARMAERKRREKRGKGDYGKLSRGDLAALGRRRPWANRLFSKIMERKILNFFI